MKMENGEWRTMDARAWNFELKIKNLIK